MHRSILSGQIRHSNFLINYGIKFTLLILSYQPNVSPIFPTASSMTTAKVASSIGRVSEPSTQRFLAGEVVLPPTARV